MALKQITAVTGRTYCLLSFKAAAFSPGNSGATRGIDNPAAPHSVTDPLSEGTIAAFPFLRCCQYNLSSDNNPANTADLIE
ncbi:hypothetical protein [Paenibacillus kobensis]|uniref:hypothetical protein n=1 Tax=Paenibacillus kobensis TaxID=59841 RepID=UPI000FDC1909|nr:hypothetical protein [Paenibacillus kobensis]